jgi:hypothetical protein
MSKEGILSILSKKIERSDSTLRQSSIVIRFFGVSSSIRLATLQAGGWVDTSNLKLKKRSKIRIKVEGPIMRNFTSPGAA